MDSYNQLMIINNIFSCCYHADALQPLKVVDKYNYLFAVQRKTMIFLTLFDLYYFIDDDQAVF